MQKWTNVLKSCIGKQKIYIMSREQQIIDAGIEYTMQNNPICIGGDNFYEASKMLNRNSSFEAGAKWADKHPKSPWISVDDDLPCNHEELITTEGNYEKETVYVITINRYGIAEENYMIYRNDRWEWMHGVSNVFWMPIPELPKEEEIKICEN